MKKVLIIAYYFPPNIMIGSQRSFGLSKYFPLYGWEPIILTVKRTGKLPEGIGIRETDYKDINSMIKSRIGFNPGKGLHEQIGITVSKDFTYSTWKSKMIKFLNEIINYPDYQRGWYKFASKSAAELLAKNKVDAIVSTSSPVISHLIARKLKRKYNIPWIADLRDLWTQNHFYKKFGLVKYFERRLELKTLSDADILVTVTKPFADNIKSFHKNKKIYCITNGYDDDEFQKLSLKLTKKFTITYTGMLYNGKRDPLLLFEVVQQLIDENIINRDLLEIRFFGHKEGWLLAETKKYKLNGVVNYYGFVSREEALLRQKESQLLLLLLDNNGREEDVYPAKVFEYLGVGRPIIAMGGSGGVIKELLMETGAGEFVKSSNMLRAALLKYYKEFDKFGEAKYHGNSNIGNYTYRSITNKYAEILNGLVMK